MAELELTTIEQSMPDGGTAIGKNFDAVKGAVDPMLLDTGWLKLPLAAGATTDTVEGNTAQYRRIGDTVLFSGMAFTAGKAAKIATLPVGFRPAKPAHANVPCASVAVTDMARVYIETTGEMDQKSAMSNISFWLDLIRYPTNDDFPS